VGRISHCRAWIALVALAAVLGCRGSAPSEPPGAWWAGRGAAVRELLAQLSALEGTPLAHRARELAAALPDCESAGAQAPDGDLAALASARCLSADDPLERIRRASGSDLVFALGGAGRPALRGSLHAERGALSLELRWPDPAADGALGLLVPGDAPAGPDRLSGTGRMVALRVRPRAGLDLAALVPAGSQADRLFRLKSAILSGAVLDGTWEGAVYLPERAGGMPGVAVALGFSLKSAAVAAIDHFIADLQQTWPVHASELHLAAGEGKCLPDLNVLPELAPCYVATGHALVIGWNPASLSRALADATGTPDAADAPARLDLDLALIQRADDLLARAFPGSSTPLRWPWRRVVASGSASGGALALRATFVPTPGSAS
jgi:hypothetical protein